ncbi:hypothetical protein ACWCQB_26045 [Streptomyces hirsutus]
MLTGQELRSTPRESSREEERQHDHRLPLVIGTVIAVGSITQDNYGGAAFAVVTGAVISLALHITSSRDQGS